MMIKLLVTFLSLVVTCPSWAITCYYTLAKDSCWINYNVSVEVIDSRTGGVLATVTVPKGQAWTRQTFDCKPAQKLTYIARFSPVFWESDIGKTYSAINYWSLPDAVQQGDSAWNVSVCYPSDFSLVPTPPSATAECTCDFTRIPEIKPKQLP
jgi:hypothetical protein